MNRCNDSEYVLNILEQYMDLAENHFSNDLKDARQKNPSNQRGDNKEHRINLIMDIRYQILQYKELKPVLSKVINDLRIDPTHVNNPLVQHLFVHIEGIYESYIEYVCYALQKINEDEHEDGGVQYT